MRTAAVGRSALAAARIAEAARRAARVHVRAAWQLLPRHWARAASLAKNSSAASAHPAGIELATFSVLG